MTTSLGNQPVGAVKSGILQSEIFKSLNRCWRTHRLITINVPNELAMQLRLFEKQLPRLLEYGLRELNATTQTGFQGMSDVLELLAQLPTPEDILALRPSETLQNHIQQLLEKSRTDGLTSEEEQQWQQYEYLEHLVRIAKTHAVLKLNR